MIGGGWMKRKEAARFITRLGYPITTAQLAYMARSGYSGPVPAVPSTCTGWRSVWYNEDDLKRWTFARLAEINQPIRS